MDPTWIVVADSSRARVFEQRDAHKPLREIDDFINPSGRADERDLSSDAHGRFYGKGERNLGHTAEPAVYPVEHENALFARTLAHYLARARHEQRYTRLRLLAAPKFLGLLRRNLDKEVQRLVEQALPKDVSGLTPAQVLAYLKEQSGVP